MTTALFDELTHHCNIVEMGTECWRYQAAKPTDTASLWVYVRDDRPFAGAGPPAALFHYSRDRRGDHPRAHLASWSGILHAEAYGGYGELYAPGRVPASVLKAGCFVHARRKSFELADVASAARKKSRGEHAGMIYPIAPEAVQRLDALFDIDALSMAKVRPSGSRCVRN